MFIWRYKKENKGQLVCLSVQSDAEMGGSQRSHPCDISAQSQATSILTLASEHLGQSRQEGRAHRSGRSQRRISFSPRTPFLPNDLEVSFCIKYTPSLRSAASGTGVAAEWQAEPNLPRPWSWGDWFHSRTRGGTTFSHRLCRTERGNIQRHRARLALTTPHHKRPQTLVAKSGFSLNDLGWGTEM